jgi:DNA-binding CsgD family transcriptional regulator
MGQRESGAATVGDGVGDLLRAAGQLVLPEAAPGALRVLAGVLDAAGSGSCVAVFEEAVESLAVSPARLELARAEFGLGSALRRRGQAVNARPHLSRAVELATCCDATGLAALAIAELRVAGGRPRRRDLSGINALTPSERRAVELAALGRTNRAIAQELYVTPKTVEVHLSSAYRKLGITSRGELAAMWPEGPAT